MVTQIGPASSSQILLAGALPLPVVNSRPASTRAERAPAQQAGTEAEAVAQVNQHLQGAQTNLKLQVDAGSGRTVFQIVQQGTGEVVLQVPSAEVLGMSRRVRDLEGQNAASGALVDKES